MLIIRMIIMRFFPNSLTYTVAMHAMEWAWAPPADRHDGVAAAAAASASSSSSPPTLMFMWAMESPGPSSSLRKALKSSDPLLWTWWVPTCMRSYSHMRNPWQVEEGPPQVVEKFQEGMGLDSWSSPPSSPQEAYIIRWSCIFHKHAKSDAPLSKSRPSAP